MGLTLRDQIIELASRPQGATGAELAEGIGRSALLTRQHTCNLRVHGLLISAKMPGLRVRYFADREQRDAWLAASPKPEPRTRPRPLVLAPSPPPPPGEPDADGVRRSYGPSPDPYRPLGVDMAAPGAGAGFAAAGIGRYPLPPGSTAARMASAR